jgi:hypothetical protein
VGLSSHLTSPPWRSAIDFTKANPKPTPPEDSLAPGKRKKGSKIWLL